MLPLRVNKTPFTRFVTSLLSETLKTHLLLLNILKGLEVSTEVDLLRGAATRLSVVEPTTPINKTPYTQFVTSLLSERLKMHLLLLNILEGLMVSTEVDLLRGAAT